MSAGHADKLALLLDALGNIPISDPERRSLIHLAGDELATVENLAAVIHRARARSATLAAREGRP